MISPSRWWGQALCPARHLVVIQNQECLNEICRPFERNVLYIAFDINPFTLCIFSHGPSLPVPCCVFPVLFPHRTVPADENTEGGKEVGGDPHSGRMGAMKSTRGEVGEVLVTERRQLVRYLARKTRGKVAFLDFEGANQVVYSTKVL